MLNIYKFVRAPKRSVSREFTSTYRSFSSTGNRTVSSSNEQFHPPHKHTTYPEATKMFEFIYICTKEQTEVRECLLSFGAESVVFQVAIQKLKDQDI
jgi:hypothetical protein